MKCYKKSMIWPIDGKSIKVTLLLLIVLFCSAVTTPASKGNFDGGLSSDEKIMASIPNKDKPSSIAVHANGKVVNNTTDNGIKLQLSPVRYLNMSCAYFTLPLFDFDLDSRSDIAIFRPSDGNWWIRRSSDTAVVIHNFGLTGDLIAPADYMEIP